MIQKIALKNWKSHRDSEFEFAHGINVLIGEMGSGKSSVLEAITYGLYGKVPAVQERKIGLDDLIRRTPSEAKKASVELEFAVNGDTYQVSRMLERGKGTTESKLRKNGSLIAGPQTTEVSEHIQQLLEIDFDLFSTIVYSEQNALDFFLNLAPGKRKEKIDQLLKLDRFETVRSNLVTLINRVKNRHDSRKKDVEKLKDGFDPEQVEKVGKNVSNLQEKIDKLQEKRNSHKETLETLQNRYDDFKEKKEQYSKLKEKRIQLQAQRKNLGQELEEQEEDIGLDMDSLTSIKLGTQRQEVQNQLQQAKNSQEKIQELDKQISVESDRLERLEKDIKKLQDGIEKAEKLEQIKNQLKELEKQQDKLRDRISQAQAEKKKARKAIQNLSKASQECPTCGKQLDDGHRTEILQHNKAVIKEREEQLEKLKTDRKTLETELNELKEKKETLLQYRNADKELEEKIDQKQELQQKIGEKQEQLNTLKNKFSEEKREQLEEQLDQLKTAEQYLKRRSRYDELKTQLGQVEDRMGELDFDEQQLNKLQEQLGEVKSDLKLAKSRLSSNREILEEKQKRLDQMQEKKQLIESYQQEVQKLDVLRDFLHDFKHALKETQTEMRRRFVDTANSVMQNVWSTIYPYDDYSSIRLSAGEDYILQLKDDRGGWVPAEGEVSGGERHSAALTLRIALATVLAPHLRLMILDEPTHNLDTRAIEDMAETLRTDVAELVDQLFLITHDEQLESAATGGLYELRKKGTGHGLTEVKSMGLRDKT